MNTTSEPHRPRASHGEQEKHRLAPPLALFVLGFLFWLLLVWPVAPSGAGLLWGDIAAGIVVAAFVALVMRERVTRKLRRLLDPTRYFWAALYLVVLAYSVTRANLDVAYRVLHPAMPIRPGIVRVRTRLRCASARTALANSITLTPGTLTVDITDDGLLYVHWINVATEEEQQAASVILGRFEWFIEKIFE